MDDIVSYEEAEMLAQLFDYRGKCTHYYKVGDKEVKEHTEPMNFNTAQRVWAGMEWKYGMYSAPTKSEAILWLMDKLDAQRRYYEKVIEIKEQKNKELNKIIWENLKKEISI